MNKALEILKKEYPLICDMSFEWGWKSCEEAMKHKSPVLNALKECDLCVHLLPKFRICMKKVQLHDGSLPKNFYCSKYKPKDNA